MDDKSSPDKGKTVHGKEGHGFVGSQADQQMDGANQMHGAPYSQGQQQQMSSAPMYPQVNYGTSYPTQYQYPTQYRYPSYQMGCIPYSYPQAGMPQVPYPYPTGPTVEQLPPYPGHPQGHRPGPPQGLPPPYSNQYASPVKNAEQLTQSYPHQGTPPRLPGMESTSVPSPRVSDAKTPPQPMEGLEHMPDLCSEVDQCSEADQPICDATEEACQMDQSDVSGHAWQHDTLTDEAESASSTSDESDDSEQKVGLLVKGLSKITDERSLQSYFGNRRRSGGGVICSLTFYEDKQSAVVYFNDAGAVDRIIQKAPHLVNKKQVDVSAYKREAKRKQKDEDSFTSEDEEEKELKTIEIRGFKEKTSDDTVELYFENPRKGGGAIASFERKEEVIYITFENAEVAKKMAEKEHNVGGCVLQVKLYQPPKPRPTYSDRLLITGIKSTTTKDCLINYLEAKGCCEIEESNVVYGDEEGTALVYFTEMPDVEKLQKLCAQRPLEGVKLTVSTVPISNSVIVKGLNSVTSDDTILYYFEGKRSGNVNGVEVEKIERKASENYAVVYFKDHTVIDEIAEYSKGHKLDNAELDVSIYYDCLGVSGGVRNPTWFKMPAPLEIKDLDKHKLNFIKQSKSSEEAFLKQLKHHHADLTWLSDPATAVRLECSLAAGEADSARLARTWAAEAAAAVKHFLSLLDVERINVLTDIWDQVETGLPTRHTEGARMFIYKDESSIVVAGYAKFGKEMAEEVKCLVKKVEDEFEKKKQTISETLNKIKLIQLRLLLASGFPKDAMKTFPDLTINIKIPKCEISFQGIVGDVKKAQVQMYEMLQKTSHSKISNISEGQLELVDKKNVRDYIVKKMKSKNLVGVWEETKKEVEILAFSDSDAVEVAQMIKKSVIENIHPLDPESIPLLASEEWSKLKMDLSDRHGELLKIITDTTNSQIALTATDNVIADAAEIIGNFFAENTIFEQTVTFPKGIQRFLQKYCDKSITKIVSNLKSLQVQIHYSATGREFTIKATKYGMDSSIKALQDVARKVKHTEFIHKRPGIRKLLMSQKGGQFLVSLETSHRCIIEKAYDSSEVMSVGSQHVRERTAAAVEGVTIAATCTAPGHRLLSFVTGDITQMRVDTIVNAANGKLDHIGGLARAIVDKGGDSIQRECSQYVSRNGEVPVGNVATSHPGQLRCKMIVHAVGPLWSGGTKGEEDLLRDAIINSLQETDKKRFTSIAIPALSCGIYSYPVPDATNTIVDAIKEYCEDNQTSSIREIYLTDTSQRTVDFFIAAGKQVFGKRKMQLEDQSVVTSRVKSFEKSRAKPTVPAKVTSHRRHGGARGASSAVNIHLVKGEIAKQQADVIVNSTSNNLELKNGAVSKSILTAAGNSLQTECQQKYPKGLRHGDVAVTSGANLKCRQVFHTCLPNWSNDAASKQILYQLIYDCMTEASKAKYNSIAFPAMGTGNLGYPRDVVAKCMKDCINDFGAKNPNSSVKDVNIVVYDKDTVTVKAFESVLSYSSSTPSSGSKKMDRSNRTFHGRSRDTEESSDWQQVSFSDLSKGFNIGAISLSVKQGDITQENVECIVNSTNERLDFSQGGVSQAIAKACGKSLRDECTNKVKKMAKKGIVSTGAKGLRCRAIVHVNISHFNDWKAVISMCLSEAENIPGVTSIAFPALGTGMHGSSADTVAEAFVAAINQHQKSGPAISDVRIIIFQPDMLQTFNDTIQTALRQNADQSWFSKGMKTVKKIFGYGSMNEEANQSAVPDDSSELPLYYYSDESPSIDGCIQAVESYCGEEILTKIVKDETLERLSPLQKKKIYELQTTCQVEVTLEHTGQLTIQGMHQDVYNAYEVVQKLLREVDHVEQERQKAEILSNIVQWRYVETDDQGQEHQRPYEKEINAVIEKAFCDKLPNVTLPADDSVYIIDFRTMQEYCAGDTTDCVKVIRKDLLKETVSAFESPSNWVPMGQDEELKVVTLPTSDQDYQTVFQAFVASVQNSNVQIIKIERIQNKTLFQQYVAKKNQISKQCSQTAERKLWHGTSHDAIVSLNMHGFNRSYCGKNATAFGDGVYFAVQARYSASNTYSRPDSQGNKLMYYASVLTGDYTQGQSGMRVPPVMSSNQSRLYDSVVDHVSGPGMFIIFNDTQAYPDYLITFKI